MSEENGKVCCNCRHNKRMAMGTYVDCHCDIDGHYIGYVACMTGWCRHWSKEGRITDGRSNNKIQR